MNWLDGVLLLILVLSIVSSFHKGISREVIGLASVVLAIILGVWFYRMAGSLVMPYVNSRYTANFIGFMLVFCGVLLLGAITRYIVGKFLRITRLSFVDHILGAGFGALRGVLVGVALIMGIMAFSPSEKPPQSVVDSRLAPHVVDAARLVTSLAPYELKENFRKTYAEVKTAWGKTFDKHGRPDNEKREHERKI